MADESDTQRQAEHDEPSSHVVLTVTVQNADQNIYSNVLGVSITPWDVRINFADYAPVRSNDPQQVKAIVGVIMSPEQAASLMKILSQQLDLFQRQYGPIRDRGFSAMPSSGAPARKVTD